MNTLFFYRENMNLPIFVREMMNNRHLLSPQNEFNDEESDFEAPPSPTEVDVNEPLSPGGQIMREEEKTKR